MENVKNSFKTASCEPESSEEYRAGLKDRRKRPDKQLYVPRALRTKKDSLVSENLKDELSASPQSSFNSVPYKGTKTQGVSDINHCTSLRPKRKSSNSVKEELCVNGFHDVPFKGIKAKDASNKSHCPLVRAKRKNSCSVTDEQDLELCASEGNFHDVQFKDAKSQNASDGNCCLPLANKKESEVSVQDMVSDSENNFSLKDTVTVNGLDLDGYSSKSKDIILNNINAATEDICSLNKPSETFNSLEFVPDFEKKGFNSENANIIEKQDSIHCLEDMNKALNYSEENISSYQPLKGAIEDNIILYECEKENSVKKELTLKEVHHITPNTEILEVHEVKQENGDINLNSFSSNIVNVSDNNLYSDSKSFDSAKENCDKPASYEDSWETMFNDEGECLDPEFANELCKVTGRMQIHVAKNSYSDYRPISEATSNEYECIVELYAFPVEFKTQDLVSSLSIFKQDAYSIKWVDDCHALAIFTSPTLANQALLLSSQFVKIRPLSEGTKESKAKARFCSRQLEPCRPRPATSAVLARRLVSGALGLKDKTSKEQRDLERNMLKEAKERKKLKAKQRQDIWDGVVL